jgi:arginine decarboxylase
MEKLCKQVGGYKMQRANLDTIVETKESTIVIGNRIPRDFFVTKGKGESDITVHAGSYHLALKEAGIEMCNIITYSSILPAQARQVQYPDYLAHGSVMETILAQADAKKGEQATAGIIYGWLEDRETFDRFGGLVCEYHGNLGPKEVATQLRQSLSELYENGFEKGFELQPMHPIIETITPQKQYGTAVVALCFLNYIIPMIKETGGK